MPNSITTYEDLKVYRASYVAAMDIFKLTRDFPKEETYSLTSQIMRSSRSVPANIREGFAMRKHANVFIKHLIIAIGSSEETRTWLDFSKDCKYISAESHDLLLRQYDQISAMLHSLSSKWQTFPKIKISDF